jgi:toxin HigB-1
VQVEFKTDHLRKCYEKSKNATKAWGEKVARRYIERVNILKGAKTADDLYKIPPLHFHPLKGNKSGLYAMTLVDRWRLEVSFTDKKMTVVKVEEVTAHYGD